MVTSYPGFLLTNGHHLGDSGQHKGIRSRSWRPALQAQRLWGRTCTPVRLPWPLRCPGHAASCPLLCPHLAFSSPRGCMVCRAQPGLRGQQQLVGCSRPGGTGSCRLALSALPPPFQGAWWNRVHSRECEHPCQDARIARYVGEGRG